MGALLSVHQGPMAQEPRGDYSLILPVAPCAARPRCLHDCHPKSQERRAATGLELQQPPAGSSRFVLCYHKTLLDETTLNEFFMYWVSSNVLCLHALQDNSLECV